MNTRYDSVMMHEDLVNTEDLHKTVLSDEIRVSSVIDDLGLSFVQ